MTRTPERIVLDFGRAWESRDPDTIIAALTEDVIYQNVPLIGQAPGPGIEG